jgi:hypothetical protein
MDVSEITIKYGYTYAKITEMARKLNLYCKKGKKYDFTEEQTMQIIKMCEKSLRPPVKISTKDVARRLNRCLTTIQTAGKTIGIVYRKAHPHDYTEEEIKRIEAILSDLKVDRKKPEVEVTYRDKSWWIDPTPKCLQDDYEEEWDD